MKIALLVCIGGGAAMIASGQTDSKKTTAPAPRTAPAEVKIPAGAVKSDDGKFYRYTDAKGKKWIYRETPFGVAKSEEKPPDPTVTPFGKAKAKDPEPAAAQPVEAKELTVAYDEGDSVRFERPTPFGTKKWTKKRSELTADEQKIVDQQQKSKQQ
jgi:hypothetical protein